MSAPARRLVDRVEAPPLPEYYRSTVTGEVLHLDDLVDCERCDGSGEIAWEWMDAYTKRWVQEVETCPTCNAHGVVEQVWAHGAHHPEPVEPIAWRTGPPRPNGAAG